MIEQRFIDLIAQELSLTPVQVASSVQLFDGGATIPFVARYRKDVTGNLNEEQLEIILDRNSYFVALTNRRKSVLENIEKQGKLSDELRQQIESCCTKTELEDLYRPYKKKQRTKATVAREQGLEALADIIWNREQVEGTLEEAAHPFLKPESGLETVEAALEGAGYIIAERYSEDVAIRHAMREFMMSNGCVASHSTKNATDKQTKYEVYHEFSEPAKTIPSHRFLAIVRGSREGLLRMELDINDQQLLEVLAERFLPPAGETYAEFLHKAFADAYQRLLRPSIENEVIATIHERADAEAIHVFRENASNLLLAPPAGGRVVMGVDPALKTGCKLAVVNTIGDYVEGQTVFPNPPHNKVEEAEKVLTELIRKHNVAAVAIGNGTGSRETLKFVRRSLAKMTDHEVFAVLVNEAGASVYSASKLAREEFPDLDVTMRGAVSIARRLQDPLAELVKIDPRHIGVGQYQHDVNQKQLREGLTRTVVSCVNSVGVELNTASNALLGYVSGIQANTSQNIIEFRAAQQGIKSRQQLMEVQGVGPKVFEQCAGFLRIVDGEEPLDSTAIHPEAYETVRKIADHLKLSVNELIGHPEKLSGVDLTSFADGIVGKHTIEDIRRELAKPSRDPRSKYQIPKFPEGIESVADLSEGMELEGVVTNVTDFGAFVDVGVEQDGLVHLSELSARYIHDPREVVKVGDIVRVKVLHVDKERPRISLSIKALAPAQPPRKRRKGKPGRPQHTASGTEGEAAKSSSDSARSGRTDGRRHTGPARKKQKKPRRNDHQPRPVAEKQPEKAERINTTLADQLAALKGKFNG